MFCNNCGKQVPEGARFCGNCGSPVAQSVSQFQQPQAPVQTPSYHQPPVQQELPYTTPVNKTVPYQTQPYGQPQYSYQQPQFQPSQNQQSAYQVPQLQQTQNQGTQTPPHTKPTNKKKILIGAAAAAVVLILMVALFGEKGDKTEHSTNSNSGSAKQNMTVVEEKPNETTPELQATGKTVMDKYPDGKLRFDEDGFFMSYEEFTELMQNEMEKNGLPFTLSDPTPVMDGTKMHYGILHESKQVGYMILEEKNGRVIEATCTYEFQSDETLDNHGVNSVLCLIGTGHGNMSQKWGELKDKEPLAQRDDYIMYQYQLDGMKAMMTMRTTSIFMLIQVDE